MSEIIFNFDKTNFMKEVSFDQKKLAVSAKVSHELFAGGNVEINHIFDDMINNKMTVMLCAYVYENLSEERDLVYTFNRPTFLDWLLRRKRKAVFKLQVKDLLLNPPKVENTKRIYITTKQ